MSLAILHCILFLIQSVIAVQLIQDSIQYSESFKLCNFHNQDHQDTGIEHAFASLPGWSAVVQHKNEFVFVGVKMNSNLVGALTVMRQVQYSISIDGDSFESSGNFPHLDQETGKISYQYGFDYFLDEEVRSKCIRVKIGLIFSAWESQVVPIAQYLDNRINSIGELSENEVKDLDLLRTQSMLFLKDENAIIQSEMVDLMSLARCSDYIRGLVRFSEYQGYAFKQFQDPLQMISSHFDTETIQDFLDISHGKFISRSEFLNKSMHHLAKMGLISSQFQMPNIIQFINECILTKAVVAMSAIELNENLLDVGIAVQYALESYSSTLFNKIWSFVIEFLEENKNQEYFYLNQIRSRFQTRLPVHSSVPI